VSSEEDSRREQMSRTVYQLVDDNGAVQCQVPLTVITKKTNRTYDVKARIRSEAHSKTGELHYVAEFYVVADHYTKITPVTIKQVLYTRGSAATRKLLSADAKIITTTVDDISIDDVIHAAGSAFD
jgi:hypothetical protein